MDINRITKIAIVLILITGCTKSNKISDNIDSQDSKNNTSIELINEKLTNTWKNEIIALSKANFFSIESKTPVENIHYDLQIDTLIIFKYQNDFIKVYTAKSDFYEVTSAEITNDKIKFSKNLKIGMRKEELESLLMTEILSDRVKISNVDNTSSFEFSFEKSKLNKIIYEGYID